MDKQKFKERLIIFTRVPKPGRVKTRLIPFLGEGRAALLMRRMAEAVVSRACELQKARGVEVEIRFSGGSAADMESWLGPGTRLVDQGPGSLGSRMARALDHAFDEGVQRAVLVGTDLPGLNLEILNEAFDSLKEHDLALGPATDGGYYLIGLTGSQPHLFRGMAWGAGNVFAETSSRARLAGLSVKALAPLTDVDTVKDLGIPAGLPGFMDVISPLVSVVIPALNEAENIEAAVKSARKGPLCEVIVADGGSTDGTIDVARNSGARVISSAPGRAGQMNLGADLAAGEVLVFLHADSTLPGDYLFRVIETLDLPGAVAGAFRLKVASDRKGLRIVELLANFRAGFLKMPYGDQAIFLTKSVFNKVGGFPRMPIMEDFELVRRLGRLGRIKIASTSVVTSPRRWERLGVVRTTLINQAVILGYYLGASPGSLARLYGRKRGAARE